MAVTLEPLRDRELLREYIEEHWGAGHVLARDAAMTDFTYATPWVDRARFPSGYSVLGAYEGDRLLGVLGAIAAPYPRPTSYWLALWHVRPGLVGSGLGLRLLAELEEYALRGDGWIGTVGAGPDALPVYLRRDFTVRGVRRWVYQPQRATRARRFHLPRHPAEVDPPADWIGFRFNRHPRLDYEIRREGVFRTEANAWGRVTHVLRMPADSSPREVYEREEAVARRAGTRYLMDAWSFEVPGPGWRRAPADLPSVFHPPEPRGDQVFAVGLPFLPSSVQKGDCDQDRPT